MRWSRDGKYFSIVDKQHFDTARWRDELNFDDEKKRPITSLTHHLSRLKHYFVYSEKNGGYDLVPKSHIDFTPEMYQTGEIFDTGSDIRRKKELRKISEADLIDLILDHEQRITDRDEEIEKLKEKLEETETINQVKLNSLEEENGKLSKQLEGKLNGCSNHEPRSGTVSSTVSDADSLEDAIKVRICMML